MTDRHSAIVIRKLKLMIKKFLFILAVFLILFLLFGDKTPGPNVSQNGIAVGQLADEIFTKYDVDKNGVLEVSNESFLTTDLDGAEKTESHGLLFTDADKFGNADGHVSEAELSNFLSEFDTDKDTELTTCKNIFHSIFKGKSEWSKFAEKYQEKYGYDKD